MKLRRHGSFTGIQAADWNSLPGTDNPFLRHEYLLALELSGSTVPATGWTPVPLTVEDVAGSVLGAMPLYIKHHSFGELVYDFAWAQAYARAGLAYYPKLVAGIPMSPVTGPRLLVRAGSDSTTVVDALLHGAHKLADEIGASSLHWLFTNEADTALLKARGYLQRTGFQFHWQNPGYENFDEFLAGFTADKRKKLRRERRHVREAGVTTTILPGAEVTPDLWDIFYDFYAGNIDRHGGMLHLTRDFFHRLGRALPAAIVLVLAQRGPEPVGAAINLRGADALYGRYWGGHADIHSLHFETCYYSPIEYCIAEKLQRFEGGAGGEHKLARGFVPVTTRSAHWLRHPQFAHAIADFLARERHGIECYMDELNEHVPYKQAHTAARNAKGTA